jgi:hypothetical protein
MQAIVNRAYHLEVISENQRRYMVMQLSKDGYRVREPFELDPRKRSRRSSKDS